MQITVAAIGRAKSHSFIDAQIAEYQKRLAWPLEINSYEVKKKLSGPELTEAEGELLEKSIAKGAVIIALDETGQNLSSREFAGMIGKLQNQGESRLCFLIGGADGLSPTLKKRAALKIAFGKMTWPHMLVRVMLCEQLYRAHTILSGHPYHRD